MTNLAQRTLLAACLLLIGPGASFSQPAPPPTPKHIILILAPGLTEQDIRSLGDAVNSSLGNAAIGWMNTRTARVPGQKKDPYAAALLTLGAGARATAGDWALNPTPETWERLKWENSKLDHPVPLNSLIQTMDLSGVRRTLGIRIGTRSEPELLWDSAGARSSPAKRNGPTGNTAQLNIVNLSRGGRSKLVFVHPQTSEKREFDWYQFLPTKKAANFIVILLSPAPADSAEPHDRLAPIAIWGGGLKPGLLTSPTTRTPGLVSNTDLVPTIARFLGQPVPKGVTGRAMTSLPLGGSSPWDRLMIRLGLRANPPPRPSAAMWADQHKRWNDQARLQSVIGGLAGLQAALLVYGLWLHYRIRVGTLNPGEDLPRRAALAAALFSLPLAMLWLPVFASTLPLAVAGLALICGTSALIAYRRPADLPRLLGAVSITLVLSLVFDLFAGSNLLRQAWMSYSVMEGARYYGIGNEYGGALLVAGLVLLIRGGASSRWITGSALTALSLVIAFPLLGANAGVFLGCAVGWAAAWLALSNRAISWKGFLKIGFVSYFLLFALAYLDSLRGDQASHIGRALGTGMGQIALRKLQLNLYLLTHSPWAFTLLVALAALVLERRIHNMQTNSTQESPEFQPSTESTPTSMSSLLAKEGARGRLEGAKASAAHAEPVEVSLQSAEPTKVSPLLGKEGARGRSEGASAYLTGLAAGAATLLLMNDSGVVAAAISLSTGWTASLTFAFQEGGHPPLPNEVPRSPECKQPA